MLETEKAEIVPFNLKTGEIVPGKILTPAMIQEIQRKKDKNKKISEEYKEYGNFYWLFYKMKEDLFDKNIDGSIVTRLVYLATYIGYDDNKIVYKNGKYIHKKDLQKILNLTDKTYKTFICQCKKYNLITINEDDTISITNKYFKKGNLYKNKKNDKSAIRMYCDTIQYLYENCCLTYHKNLGYLYALIPYINIEYNIVCSNPKEKDVKNICPLSLKDICKICGFSIENYRHFKNKLLNIKIKNKPVIRLIEDIDNIIVYINPSIFYAGHNHKQVEILGEFTGV